MIVVRRTPRISSYRLPICDSQLGISTDIIYLGEESNETVHVSWNLSKAANMIDWIGLFNENERNPMNYLDHKGRGIVGSAEGTVEWNVIRANLPKSVNGIYFGYVDGITGIVLAKSPTIRITKKASLIIHGVRLFSDVSYYFYDKSRSSDILKLTLSGCSTSYHLPENRKSICTNSRFALFENSTLEIDVGKTRCIIPTQEIDLLSGELGLAVQTDQRHSFTVVLTVSVEPMSGEVWESRMDSRGRTFYLDHITKRTTWQRPVVEYRRDTEATKRYSMVRRTIGISSLPVPIYGPSQFLQRPDFISILHENQVALLAYNSSPVVKHIIHRIRKGGEPSEKYENNRDFVAFVNMFADDTQPLPFNWQATGRNPTVFIDHTTRRTTLIDPRLPSVSVTDKKRGRSAPPTRRPNMFMVVGHFFTSVYDNIEQLLGRWKWQSFKYCESNGRNCNILDADEPVTTSELEEKLNHFYSSLHRSGYGIGPQKVKLRFSRSNLLRDAFDQILSTDSQTLRKARLSITFDDEEGLDYGGPSRELFFLLSRELFNPYYGLFEYSSADQYTVQISSMSSFVEHELQWLAHSYFIEV
uniref:HECT-type E3 ubiquitin transferase n=1 Tax=Heterorhabditis bacteriophora TaxID=37862 RepID=A0A1I7XQR5_HETBA